MLNNPRWIAKAAGESRYTGKPCKHGHGGLRLTASGGCAECRRLTKAAARKTVDGQAKRTLRKKRYQQRMRVERPEKWAEMQKRRYELKKARIKAGLAKRSKPSRAVKARQRKERKLAQHHRVPSWAKTAEQRTAIALIYARRRELTEQTGVLHEVDHFYPLRGKTVSGLHVAENLRVVVAHANRSKGALHPAEFLLS